MRNFALNLGPQDIYPLHAFQRRKGPIQDDAYELIKVISSPSDKVLYGRYCRGSTLRCLNLIDMIRGIIPGLQSQPDERPLNSMVIPSRGIRKFKHSFKSLRIQRHSKAPEDI